MRDVQATSKHKQEKCRPTIFLCLNGILTRRACMRRGKKVLIYHKKGSVCCSILLVHGSYKSFGHFGREILSERNHLVWACVILSCR